MGADTSQPLPIGGGTATRGSTVPPGRNDKERLKLAVEAGDGAVVGSLLAKSPKLLLSIDKEQGTPLHVAVEAGKHRVLRLLLSTDTQHAEAAGPSR
jgi:hypothetical protein